MRHAYDVDQIKAAEAPLLASLPDGALMARAATALARRCAALLPRVYGARVVVLAGSGNNGGDAMFAGAQLARRGAAVTVLCATDNVHAQALQALLDAGGRTQPTGTDNDAALLCAADLVLDGLLGIGGRGGLRPPYERLAALTADSGAVVVAVDVPSGVDAATGCVEGAAVRADVTVTFGGLKVGLVVAPGADYAGVVDVADIGLRLPTPNATILDADDVAQLLPTPTGETDKYRRGVLGVAAGSDTYTGAAVLAVGGALATGVGMVRYVGTPRAAAAVRAAWPDVVVTELAPTETPDLDRIGRVQAWVVGSGLGTDEHARNVVRAILATDVPVVADADALTWLAADPDPARKRTAPTLLTPHAGEFARLIDTDRSDVEAHRLDLVRRAATDLNVAILLKGSTTLVAMPNGAVRINTADTAYLATAGSGDVLSGICGALFAGGLGALDAGSAGAFLHGLAGLAAAGDPAVSVTATDIVRALPIALRTVCG